MIFWPPMLIDIIKEFGKARNLLNSAERILIISHLNPDADSISANCALKELLRRFGKEVVSACIDSVPNNCRFLEGANEFVNDFPVNEFDLFVSVDCGHKNRTGFSGKTRIFDGSIPFINIDHHDTNDLFGTVNVIDKKACSTCSILLDFFDCCDYKITKSIATALLAGIYFDTGSLMHSNVSPEVFSSAARLMRLSADLQAVTKNLFKTIPIPQMHLLGRILERTRVTSDGVTTSAAMKSDYKEVGAKPEDAACAVDFLNAVSGSRFCVLLSDNDKGEVKGSVRTQRNDLDISKVASALGGGGHKKAAGFGVPGKLREERVFKIVEE